ncbi:MAG: tRNA (adenosine(37)-N6)-threonylcarbamoyltransferase complex ATPase subunit type 1 TsaE [Bacteroidota bacterium]
MKKEYKSTSTYDLPNIAKSIISDFSGGRIFLFYGSMGAGKTTLIKSLVHELGIEDVANSPTFALVNEYFSKKNGTIFHFDFYRLEDETEALDMGYEDYFYSNSYCFVEWPEKIPNLLPSNIIEVTIDASPEERLITVKSN